MNYIASIITIINFIYSLFVITEKVTMPHLPFSSQGLPMSFIFIVFLEIFLASGFGYILVKFAEKGHGIPFMLFITVALISAWTTMFNIQWIIIKGPLNTFVTIFTLVILSVLFCGLACYFIVIHSKDKQHIDFDSDNVVPINQNSRLIEWQFLAFIVMFIFIMSS